MHFFQTYSSYISKPRKPILCIYWGFSQRCGWNVAKSCCRYLPVEIRRSRLESRHTKYVGAIRSHSLSKYVGAKVEENAFFSNVLFIYFQNTKTDFVYLLRSRPKMRRYNVWRCASRRANSSRKLCELGFTWYVWKFVHVEHLMYDRWLSRNTIHISVWFRLTHVFFSGQ